jgi:diguanylate cyclase (GGDEF)-like protein
MKGNRLTFGFILDSIVSWADTDYYQSLVLSGILDFAETNDINTISFVAGKLNSKIEWESGRNILYELIDVNKVDGLIILTSAVDAYATKAEAIKKIEELKKIPIVIIGDSYEGYPSVLVDNTSGMKQVVNHLIEEHNCKKLAFIKGFATSNESETRFKAFCESLNEHNIPIYDKLIYKGDFVFSSGAEAVKSFIERKLEFDAVVAANDNMAIGAIEELNKQSDSRYRNIPVTGFDNVEISRVNSLTTVNQPCYDMGFKAAQTLYEIINSEYIENVMALPSHMVKRSSCGCIPDAVKKSFYETKKLGSKLRDKDISEFKKIVIEHLKVINRTSDIINLRFFEEFIKYEEKLIDAFFEEVEEGKKDAFLHSWNELINISIYKGIDPFFLNDVMSAIRLLIIDYIREKDYAPTIENIFHLIRIQISEAIRRVGSTLSILSQQQNDKLIVLEETLISNMDRQVQMNHLEKLIYDFEVDRCYVSLYEDPFKPLDCSKLIFAGKKGERFDTGEYGIKYPTRQLLPESFINELYAKRFNIIVQALCLGNNQLGYLVFGFRKRINRAFEIIRYRLSIALNGSLMIERIRNQSVELERQVIKRTKELSLANSQLVEEINKRTEAENKLRAILDELAEYNNQLRYQTIRDELTGLYNRRGFMRIGFEQYQNFKSKNKGFLMFYADVDGLKQINDKYGHNEGDIAIKSVGELLSKSFRDTDIIARIGGDEFTVIALGASPIDENTIMDRLNMNFNKYNKRVNKEYSLSVSMGSAYFNPSENTEFEMLMKLADEALYKEKQKKKGISGNKYAIDKTT